MKGPTSLEDLQAGRGVSGDCGTSPTIPPKWLSPKVYSPEDIKSFFHDHAFSIVFAWHCSLTIGFSLPTLLEALVFTNNSNTPKKALRRYVNTGTHLASWHNGNLFDSTTKAFGSLQGVRSGHAAVRKDMDSKLPGKTWLSMYNMACVQTGFVGALTIVPSAFGLHATEEELEKYVLFWKCIGYQLGVADQYNLCSLGKVTADKIIWEVINKVLLPDAHNPPKEYPEMAGAYIDGLNLLFLGLPILSVKSTLAFSYAALGQKVPPMCLCDHLRVCLLKLLVCLISVSSSFNGLMNHAAQATIKGGGERPAKKQCSRLAWVVLLVFATVCALGAFIGYLVWEGFEVLTKA